MSIPVRTVAALDDGVATHVSARPAGVVTTVPAPPPLSAIRVPRGAVRAQLFALTAAMASASQVVTEPATITAIAKGVATVAHSATMTRVPRWIAVAMVPVYATWTASATLATVPVATAAQSAINR
jgi:hypothetical protein